MGIFSFTSLAVDNEFIVFSGSRIANYLTLMARRNIAGESILKGVDIHENQLSNPHFRATMAQSQKIIENMLIETGNNALGFEIGREITIADMGLVGHGMLASPTFREVINLWASYAPMLYGTMMQIELREELNTWSMLMKESLPAGPCYQFCMEEYLMLVLKLNSKLRGYPSEYHSLSLIYPTPQNAKQYELFFACPVEFNASHNRISVKSPKLDEPVQTHNKYMHGVYLDYCEKLAAGIHDAHPFSEKVRQYLVQHLGREISIEIVASEMDCSISTLRRRLQEEGTGFRDILARFRMDFAMEYLKATSMGAKQVGFLLGYRDTKAFLRAFKSWTGKTVGDFKKQYGVAK